jgi:hypothetical protein
LVEETPSGVNVIPALRQTQKERFEMVFGDLEVLGGAVCGFLPVALIIVLMAYGAARKTSSNNKLGQLTRSNWLN